MIHSIPLNLINVRIRKNHFFTHFIAKMGTVVKIEWRRAVRLLPDRLPL
jgi:hypothetical protein